MRQTMAEKVFSRTAGREVRAGEYISATPDRVMCHEGFLPAVSKLIDNGITSLWDPERVVVILDHYVPAPSERKADSHKQIREMVCRFGVTRFHGERDGICHQVMIEGGHVRPGDLIVGTDSHTCTYGALGAAGTGIGTSEMAYVLATGDIWFQVPFSVRIRLIGRLPESVSVKDVGLAIARSYGSDFANYFSIEFTGEVAESLSISSRIVLSNLAIEFGAKFGFFEADAKTLAFLKEVGTGSLRPFGSDEGAAYEVDYVIDVSTLDPLVALPHSLTDVKPVREVAGYPIQQAFLGSCSNGRLEDLRVAAEILKGKSVAPSVRMLVYPASRATYRRAIDEGIIQILSDAGCIVCPPSCGPCFGDHGGLLGAGESCISSTNRNFKGRMGSSRAEVFLASPATVAASALRGVISDPREVR